MLRKSLSPEAYLVFTGGGVRTFASLGTLHELSQQWQPRWWKNCRGYYGVSAGAIISMLLALDFSIEDLITILMEFPFEKFFQPSIDCFLQNWCLDNSQNLTLFLKSILTRKNLHENITLLEFYHSTKQEIHIIVSNLTSAQTNVWNHLTQPHIPLVKAILASSALPFIFPHMIHENQVFIDGAYFCPYPFILVPQKDWDQSLGIYSRETSFHHPKDLPQTLKDYVALCFSSSREFIMNPYANSNFWKRTIPIQVPNIQITDFELNDEKRKFLLQQGIQAAKSFINYNRLSYAFQLWKKNIITIQNEFTSKTIMESRIN